jgi:C1A family cysteine protease
MRPRSDRIGALLALASLAGLIAGITLGIQSLAFCQEIGQVGAGEDDSDVPVYTKGYIPPAVDLSHLRPRMIRSAAPLPTRLDWREQGKITSVKNQGSCGACYIFAALANFESKLLRDGGDLYDFSENNVKECEWHGFRCSGGNYWIVANYLTVNGTALESCDLYQPYNSYTCKDTCAYIKTLLDWRVISGEEIPEASVLKSYLQTYGPIFVAIYAGYSDNWEKEFSKYDGSGVLHYECPDWKRVNHAVLLVGWDDTLSYEGGQGAWIAKNSWGTNWGGTCDYGTERGFFYIAYGSAKIGQLASFIYDWQDYNPSETVLHHDKGGWFGESAGFPGTTTDWGMCGFTPPGNGMLKRVEFWALDEYTDVDVYVYDDYSGGTASNLLASELNHGFEHAGYHSITLSEPLLIEAGNDIYVALKITAAETEFPLVVDKTSDPSGKCYRSPNGNTWYEYPTEGNLGIRARVLLDEAAPREISSLDTDAGDGRVTLLWVNPDDADFSHTLIAYSDTGYPADPSEGTPVENGEAGKFFAAPASADSFNHTGLLNNVTYYYAAFAGDLVLNYSGPVNASATPFDTLPPLAVVSFTAEGTDRAVKLRWTNPDDDDLTGVLVMYADTSPGLSTPDWVTVDNGNNGVFAATSAAADSFTHSGLENGVTYYYSIEAFDEMRNYASALYDSAMTVDNVPPGISISVFQNPYITKHLDIYVILSEDVLDTSFTVTIGSTGMDMELADPASNVYRCDYDVYLSGVLTIKARARDANLNWGQRTRTFSATMLAARMGGTAISTDGRLGVYVPDGALSEDITVLIFDLDEVMGGVTALYEVSPASYCLDGTMAVSIAYGSGAGDPEHLCIARVEDGAVEPLESFVDRSAGKVTTYVSRFGTYGLYRDESVRSADLRGGELKLLQNAPNPFKASTTVAYEIARRARLKVEVVSVEGRLVKTLWTGEAMPGRHQLIWDGTDRDGRRVASGVYLYRVTGEAGNATRKMVLLQ